jgi:twitching motility protein PilI
MSKKISLHEFQSYLAARLAGTSNQSSAGLLGVQAGPDYWLLDLADSGEIVPLTPLTEVPLTKPWFAGIANIRGTCTRWLTCQPLSARKQRREIPARGYS